MQTPDWANQIRDCQGCSVGWTRCGTSRPIPLRPEPGYLTIEPGDFHRPNISNCVTCGTLKASGRLQPVRYGQKGELGDRPQWPVVQRLAGAMLSKCGGRRSNAFAK